jgi:NAD-dependent deacetylase
MKIEEAAAIINNSKSIVALTGAGISTNAGIPDFRGAQGIYTTGRYPADVFDIDKFAADPSVFFRFARDFLQLEDRLNPTFTHHFLSLLEKTGKLKAIVTQNIDGLHKKAGSQRVIEVHGGFLKSFCIGCGQEYDLRQMKQKIFAKAIPLCDRCQGVIKPDVVFFGEAVKGMNDAIRLVKESDLLLVIGTSLTVYPAASLPEATGGSVMIVNKGKVAIPSVKSELFDCDIDDFFKKVSKALKLGPPVRRKRIKRGINELP